MNPDEIIIGFSVALYSTWIYHKPTRCLFDAGEGIATALGKKVFAIQHVFLTHGHEDHICGLSNIVNVRNLTSGERDKPLIIYYPKYDSLINAQLECIEKKQSGLLRFPLYAQPLEVGDSVELEGTKRPTRVNAYEMKHVCGQLALAYEVTQERKEIDEYSGISVQKNHPIFFYTGDGYEPDYSSEGRIDMALYDATFLARDVGEESRRVGYRHATVEKAVDWAAGQDVKSLVLFHISERYDIDDVIAAAAEARQGSDYRGELYILYRDAVVRVP